MMEAINLLSSDGNDWVLGVTEPGVIETDDFLVDYNQFFQSTRSGKAAIFTTSTQWELLWAPDDADLIVIRRTDIKRDLIVSCVYISPTNDIKTTKVKEITKRYHDFFRQHPSSHHILMGDFNARHPLWSFQQQNEMGNVIGNCLLHLRMESVIQPNSQNWTRWDTIHNSYSWIDAIMITTKLRKFICKREVLDINGSDHRMIKATISETWIEKRLSYSRMDRIAKNRDLSFLDVLPSTSKEADDCLTRLVDELSMTQRSSITTYEPRKKSRPPIKLTKIARQGARRVKNFAMNRKTFPQEIPSLARMCVNRIDIYNIHNISRIIKKIKTRASQKMMADIERRKGPWAIIKKGVGKHSVKAICQYTNNSYQYKNQSSPSEDLIRAYKHSSITISPKRTLEVYFDIENCLNEAQTNTLIKKATAKMCAFDTNLSCIPLRYLLKHHQRSIIRFICYCISCNHIPAFIKKAKTRLIPKSDPTKYRPLSILHPLYRLIDAIIFYVLKDKINPSLLQFQYAFTENRAPIDLHLQLKNIYQSLLKDGLPIVIISIDLSDAFEQISFSAIRCGLKNMGVDETLIKIIINHIINRQSFINTIKGKSWKTNQSGTPQGGFLSPLLFIIGLSSLWCLNNYSFRILAYADDIYIIAQTENMMNPWFDVNQRLYELNSLLSAMNLAPNATKSKFCLMYSPEETSKRGNIKLMLGNKAIAQQRSINILGVELKPEKENHGIVTVANNTASDKTSKLRTMIIPLASRIQGLKLRHSKILLEALFMGSMNYYCPLQRIWSSYDTFQQQCQESMEKCGSIVKIIWGLKLNFSNIMAYYIVFQTHLAVQIEKLLFTYILREKSSSIDTIHCVEKSSFDPYGIRITETLYSPIVFPRSDYKKYGQSPRNLTLKWNTKRIKFDIWVKLELNESNNILESKVYRFWCPDNYHLDLIDNCIFQFVYGSTSIRRQIELSIETNKSLQLCLTSPTKKSRTSTLAKELKLNLSFTHKSGNFLEISNNDLKTIPRDVIKFSTRYWRLFDIYSHLSEAETHESNIIQSCLHFSKFEAFRNLDKIWRFDLHNICLLSGTWRQSDLLNNCPMCNSEISTRTLLFGCCSWFKNGSVKQTPIGVQNIVKLSSNIILLRGVFTHFRSNLKKVPTTPTITS